ncbi:MAG: GtrA family protein [Actinobacteria bacterium]|nr:GtrA family protein [Actinomycetota bacterium]
MRPFSSLVERVRTPGGRKALRYSLVSVVSVAVSQTSLFLFFAVGHWTAKSANIAACSIGGIPSYYLNRRWAWGKKGRSHFWKEIVPFWTLAFIGLALSTLAVDVAESWAHEIADSRLLQGMIVNAASFGAFGVLWVAKFFLFNKVIFVQDDDLRELLAEEVVA